MGYGQRISKSFLFLFSIFFLCVFSSLVMCHWPRIYRSVRVHENGKGQPFNQAIKAMRQESDTLKYFLFLKYSCLFGIWNESGHLWFSNASRPCSSIGLELPPSNGFLMYPLNGPSLPASTAWFEKNHSGRISSCGVRNRKGKNLAFNSGIESTINI